MALVPKMGVEESLRKLIPLNTLEADGLERLLPDISFEKVRSGDYLFHQGDIDQQNVYLLSGRVSLMSDRSEVDVVVGGSNLAKFPLAHRIPRECSAIAKSRCEVVRIDSTLLVPLLSDVKNPTSASSEATPESGSDWMSQLLASRVFQRIPPSHIQAVMRRMEAVEVDAGQEITRQGETGDYFYLINRGVCQVSRRTSEGDTELLAKLGPGSCFGEEALLSNRPRGCTVTMVEEGLLLQLSGEDFSSYVKSSLFQSVDYPEALEMVGSGAVWLDVRSQSDHRGGSLPGSINIPLGQLRHELTRLVPEECHIVCCQDEQTSTTAAFLLIEAGIDAVVLKGGIGGLPDGSLVTADTLHGQPEADTAEHPQNSEAESAGTGSAAPDEAAVGVRVQRESESALIQALEQAQGERDDAKEQLEAALKEVAMLERQLRELGQSGDGPGRDERADMLALKAELATLSTALDESYEDYEKVVARAERAEDECSRLKQAMESNTDNRE